MISKDLPGCHGKTLSRGLVLEQPGEHWADSEPPNTSAGKAAAREAKALTDPACPSGACLELSEPLLPLLGTFSRSPTQTPLLTSTES